MSAVRRTFPVEGMGCAACVARVENAIKAHKGVLEVNVSLATATARVDYDSSICTPESIQKAVQDAGYNLVIEGTADEVEDEADRSRERFLHDLRRDTIVAGVVAVLVMILAMAFKGFPFKNGILAILTLVSIYAGRRFFISAWKQMKKRTATMDTLVALSVSISFLYSLIISIFPTLLTSRGLPAQTYFESASMITAFILIGRYLEEKAKRKTAAAVKALTGLQPRTVTLRKIKVENGVPVFEEVVVGVESVKPGDIVIIHPGERITVDGVVTTGHSLVDETLLTGESEPVLKEGGVNVFAGTVNGEGILNVKVLKENDATVLAAIIRLVRDAEGSKAPIEKTVDKVAAVFVPVIMGIAILTFILWAVFAPYDGVVMGLLAMVAVLVIACPCSLGLATPTAIVAGIGNGASQGILIKDAASLQNARKIDTVVLDKTGTITVGSTIAENGIRTPDRVKTTTPPAIATLKAMGVKPVMLTGDREEEALRIAAEAGLDEVHAGVSPVDKSEFVSALQSGGRKVAMVGDGINDSAALAVADLSIAMGKGSEIAMDSAMVTIVSSDLGKIPSLIKLSRRTDRIIKENLFWAFFYNLLAVPLAAGLFYLFTGLMLSPMVAAACMALSSVTVVCNSLRLVR
ncbi:MAG: heavy metal translocating P-type ATPase [Bacteroidales bacterium]|nr:heavy metal translocating P-type ATPase [Bacteroidales bacterium]